MIDTTQIRLGQVVTSLAGRDKGRKMVVVEIVDDVFVKVADGDLRRIAHPKVKKIKHLNVSHRIIEDIARTNYKLTDEKLRKLLEAFNSESCTDGGAH